MFSNRQGPSVSAAGPISDRRKGRWAAGMRGTGPAEIVLVRMPIVFRMACKWPRGRPSLQAGSHATCPLRCGQRHPATRGSSSPPLALSHPRAPSSSRIQQVQAGRTHAGRRPALSPMSSFVMSEPATRRHVYRERRRPTIYRRRPEWPSRCFPPTAHAASVFGQLTIRHPHPYPVLQPPAPLDRIREATRMSHSNKEHGDRHLKHSRLHNLSGRTMWFLSNRVVHASSFGPTSSG